MFLKRFVHTLHSTGLYSLGWWVGGVVEGGCGCVLGWVVVGEWGLLVREIGGLVDCRVCGGWGFWAGLWSLWCVDSWLMVREIVFLVGCGGRCGWVGYSGEVGVGEFWVEVEYGDWGE